MAQNLQLLKRRIRTSKNIAQIAKAMEMISASKIKRAQKTVEANKPYHERITNLTGALIKHADLGKFNHPFLSTNNSDKTLVIIISPDKGLCGSLNTNLFKMILEQDDKNKKYVVIGKKAQGFASRLAGEYIEGFNIGTTLPDYSMVFRLIEIINEEYVKGKVGSVKIIYSQFNSVFSQNPVTKTVLPVEIPPHEEQELPYIFEPTAAELLTDLLPYYAEVVLYSAIIEAYTSEQAARMVAMGNAKNNALDIADYLTLIYNKSRQERITSELLALSSAN